MPLTRAASAQDLRRMTRHERTIAGGTSAFAMSSNQFVERREGHVFSSGSLLKNDHFLEADRGHQLPVHVSGAPNYRSVNGVVVAVGQPTAFGVRSLLTMLQKRVLWINLREEPVLYINDRPFVLRDAEHPLRNMRSFRDISAQSLEELEQRLKVDVLSEARANGGLTLVHREIPLRHSNKSKQSGKKQVSLRACWEAASPPTVQTAAEFFAKLSNENTPYPSPQYVRVPMTPESVPAADDCTEIMRLVRQAWHKDSETVVVFNDQSGRGRCTLATVLATIVAKTMGVCCRSPFKHLRSTAPEAEEVPFLDDLAFVSQLLRVLPDGERSKQLVQTSLESSARVYDLQRRLKDSCYLLENARGDAEKHSAMSRTRLDLRRYARLLCVAACVIAGQTDFAEWLEQHADLTRFIDTLCEDDALERAVTPVSQLQLATPMEKQVVLSRSGNVLSKGTILKRAHFAPRHAVPSLTENMRIPGAPNFRSLLPIHMAQLPKSLSSVSLTSLAKLQASSSATPILDTPPESEMSFVESAGSNGENMQWPIAATAQWSVSGLRRLMALLSRFQGDAKHVEVVSLLEEPVLFLGEKPFVLRDAVHPFRALPEFEVRLEADRLRQVEHMLCDEAKAEIEDDTLLAHYETPDRRIAAKRVNVTAAEVRTMDDVCEELHLSLTRVPVKPCEHAQHRNFDRLCRVLLRANRRESVVLFTCARGLARSTVASVAAVLLRAALFGVQFEGHENEIEGDPRGIVNLVRLLHQGRQAKRQVDHAIKMCSSAVCLRKRVFDAWSEVEKARVEDTSEVERTAAEALSTYANLLVFGAFVRHCYWRKLRTEEAPSFAAWLEGRPEVTRHLAELSESPGRALQWLEVKDMDVDEDDEQRDHFKNLRLLSGRQGDVLVSHSMLKLDYFVGCRNLALAQPFVGAPNFRFLRSLGVVGCAAPTVEGIRDVVRAVAHDRDAVESLKPLEAECAPLQPLHMLWFNLREEPVTYVQNQPFVLRDTDVPYQNLEFTGIDYKRVHQMEQQLKQDAAAEAETFGGRLLLHDENEEGTLVGRWADVMHEDGETMLLRTTAETWESAFQDCCLAPHSMLTFRRIPITDEQAPLPKAVDAIVRELEHAAAAFFTARDMARRDGHPEPRFVIAANCQMGRGRTTTGMLLASMWQIRQRLVTPPVMTPREHTGEFAHLLRGDFKCVRDLLRLLPRGNEAKHQIDALIDSCAHMQNLREAITEMHTRSVTAIKSSVRESMRKRAVGYLQRYCFLVGFAAYVCAEDVLPEQTLSKGLGVEHDGRVRRVQKGFAEWIDERRAVQHVFHAIHAVE